MKKSLSTLLTGATLMGTSVLGGGALAVYSTLHMANPSFIPAHPDNDVMYEALLASSFPLAIVGSLGAARLITRSSRYEREEMQNGGRTPVLY